MGMSSILDLVKDLKVIQAGVGDVVIEQGKNCGAMLVLLEGEVEVLRNDVSVAKASQPGVVFGEMSVLLGQPHSASVRAVAPSRFAVIENPREFLESSARASLFMAELLASRLDAVTKYLIDVKRQYEGHDHLGMVDDVLDSLMHRPRRKQ